MFLAQEQLGILSELSQLHNGVCDGKKGKLWLCGLNDCQITDVHLKQSKVGTYFITVTFKRKPCFVHGVKTKLYFVPHTEYYFDTPPFISLFHELKPKPDDMSKNEYLTHVARRVRTFIGNELKVVVAVYKELRKDEFGFNESRNFLRQEDILDSRMKIISYHKEDIKVDYEMLYNILKNS